MQVSPTDQTCDCTATTSRFATATLQAICQEGSSQQQVSNMQTCHKRSETAWVDGRFYTSGWSVTNCSSSLLCCAISGAPVTCPAHTATLTRSSFRFPVLLSSQTLQTCRWSLQQHTAKNMLYVAGPPAGSIVQLVAFQNTMKQWLHGRSD